GVDLPVPDLFSRLYRRGSLREGALAGQFSAAIVAAVALAASLAGAAQVRVEQPSLALISPDVAVDGLAADPQPPLPGEMSGHLFGAPLPAQQLLDQHQVLGGEPLITSRAGASPLSALLRLARAVVAVEATAVAAKLAADSATVAAERACNLGLVEPLPSEHGEH